MTEEEKRRIIDALQGYTMFKSFLDRGEKNVAVMLCKGAGAYEYISADDIPKAVALAEETLSYFELQDEAKAAFVKTFFFKRAGRVKTTFAIGISYGTITNWRNEAIGIAEKIARKNGFLGQSGE